MSAREELMQVVENHRAAVERNERVPMPSDWTFGRVDDETARHAAVLILFGHLDNVPAVSHDSTVSDELDVLLLERARTLRKHPGQIAFPGGGVDDTDRDVTHTALREAVEETGLDPAGVDVLGRLQLTELPVTNFLVTPVIGWWTKPSPVEAVDVNESRTVFRAPVADLLNPENRRSVRVERDGHTHFSPGFVVGERVVWGFTAIVLDRLFNEAGWTIPWEPAEEITPPFSNRH